MSRAALTLQIVSRFCYTCIRRAKESRSAREGREAMALRGESSLELPTEGYVAFIPPLVGISTALDFLILFQCHLIF